MPDGRPKPLFQLTFLYDTYVLLNSNYCLGNWTALLVRNPAAYLLLVLVYIASKQFIC